jgi:hypothetical protein
MAGRVNCRTAPISTLNSNITGSAICAESAIEIIAHSIRARNPLPIRITFSPHRDEPDQTRVQKCLLQNCRPLNSPGESLMGNPNS